MLAGALGSTIVKEFLNAGWKVLSLDTAEALKAHGLVHEHLVEAEVGAPGTGIAADKFNAGHMGIGAFHPASAPFQKADAVINAAVRLERLA